MPTGNSFAKRVLEAVTNPEVITTPSLEGGGIIVSRFVTASKTLLAKLFPVGIHRPANSIPIYVSWSELCFLNKNLFNLFRRAKPRRLKDMQNELFNPEVITTPSLEGGGIIVSRFVTASKTLSGIISRPANSIPIYVSWSELCFLNKNLFNLFRRASTCRSRGREGMVTGEAYRATSR
jgi:hypothetical protein